MLISILYIFLISLLISLVITAQVKKLKYVTRNEISQLGGVAIWSSFLVASSLALIFKGQQLLFLKETLGIFVCSTFIFIVGLQQ